MCVCIIVCLELPNHPPSMVEVVVIFEVKHGKTLFLWVVGGSPNVGPLETSNPRWLAMEARF